MDSQENYLMSLVLLSGKKLLVSGEKKIEIRTEVWDCFHILLLIADILTAALWCSLPSSASSLPDIREAVKLREYCPAFCTITLDVEVLRIPRKLGFVRSPTTTLSKILHTLLLLLSFSIDYFGGIVWRRTLWRRTLRRTIFGEYTFDSTVGYLLLHNLPFLTFYLCIIIRRFEVHYNSGTSLKNELACLVSALLDVEMFIVFETLLSEQLRSLFPLITQSWSSQINQTIWKLLYNSLPWLHSFHISRHTRNSNNGCFFQFSKRVDENSPSKSRHLETSRSNT